MLLTAMYSEEEADVTAKKIVESALCLQGRILRNKTIRWLGQRMFAWEHLLQLLKVVRDR